MLEEMMQHMQFKTLTPIQEKIIASIDDSRHIVGLAPTGTGKTHAYLLPILSRLDYSKKVVQAVILVPTNELVIQVAQMIKDLELKDLVLKSYYGSMNMQKEVEWLAKNQPMVVVSTPSKLFDLVRDDRVLRIHQSKYLVMDEADMMFDEDFLSVIDQALSEIKIDKFVLMSATITSMMKPFINKYFGQHILIDTTDEHELNIKYLLLKETQDRSQTLSRVVDAINPYLALIFVSKKENAIPVYQMLSEKGANVCHFSSDLNVKQRKKLLEEIHDLKYQYGVASDLAARGIDFKASHVIHYDLPYQLEFFKHRSGRTGRMGGSGTVIVIYGPNDQSKLSKLKNQGINFLPAQITAEGIKEIVKKRTPFTEDEINKIKKIKTSKKVTPNYKKNHQKLVKSAVKKIKRSRFIHGTKNR